MSSFFSFPIRLQQNSPILNSSEKTYAAEAILNSTSANYSTVNSRTPTQLLKAGGKQKNKCKGEESSHHQGHRTAQDDTH